MRRRRLRVAAVVLLLVGILTWVACSMAWPVPEIRVGMAEPEVEAVLGRPGIRTHEEGHSGVGVYRPVPRWLVGRSDAYVVTYDRDGRVAQYDLFEPGIGGSGWTHR